jgi:hypothetical protein
VKLIRHNLSGVWFGEFNFCPTDSAGPDRYESTSARRLRRWYGPSDLSGVANGHPLKADSWTTPAVGVTLLADGTAEVLTVTERGQTSLAAVAVRDSA